jgi:hypothetical protein
VLGEGDPRQARTGNELLLEQIYQSQGARNWLGWARVARFSFFCYPQSPYATPGEFRVLNRSVEPIRVDERDPGCASEFRLAACKSHQIQEILVLTIFPWQPGGRLVLGWQAVVVRGICHTVLGLKLET